MLIFRKQSFRHGKLKKTYDRISNDHRRPGQHAVLLIDRSELLQRNREDSRYVLKGAGSREYIHHSMHSMEVGTLKVVDGSIGGMVIDFHDDKANVIERREFTMFQKDYKVPADRIKGLPSKDETWEFAHQSKEEELEKE
ncbi:MAG: hypothetical protein ACKV0T_09330 [Planctomycetales bacterium]